MLSSSSPPTSPISGGGGGGGGGGDNDSSGYLSRLNKAVRRKHMSVDYSQSSRSGSKPPPSSQSQQPQQLPSSPSSSNGQQHRQPQHLRQNSDSSAMADLDDASRTSFGGGDDLWTLTKSPGYSERSPPPSGRFDGDHHHHHRVVEQPSSTRPATAAATAAVPNTTSTNSMLVGSVSQAGFRQLTVHDVAVVAETKTGEALPMSPKSELAEWAQMPGTLVHRQGLKAPPLVASLDVSSARPVFQLYLPQTNSQQSETQLVCRKKRKQRKWRFSLNPDHVSKRGNPDYVGKMTLNKSGWFIVTASDGRQLAHIQVVQDAPTPTPTSTPTPTQSPSPSEQPQQQQQQHKHGNRRDGAVHMKLTDGTNTIEGTDGMLMGGMLRGHSGGGGGGGGDCLMSLKMNSSKRTVCEVHKPGTHTPNEHRYVIEYDYPLTLFVCFAVTCATESVRLGLL